MTKSEFPRSAPAASPGARVGITEATIRYVVTAFYARISIDPLLGPIFNRFLGNDWAPHLSRMCDFWSSVLLLTGRFKGAPIEVHAQMQGLEARHFDQWQRLFRETASDVCAAPAAALFSQKADMIGRTLFAAIGDRRAALVFKSRSAGTPLH